MRSVIRGLAACGIVAGLAGLGGSAALSGQSVTLGPADGRDLPAADLERVAAGTEAPLFSLESFEGDTVSLAEFRGQKNVVLVFYRGHW